MITKVDDSNSNPCNSSNINNNNNNTILPFSQTMTTATENGMSAALTSFSMGLNSSSAPSASSSPSLTLTSDQVPSLQLIHNSSSNEHGTDSFPEDLLKYEHEAMDLDRQINDTHRELEQVLDKISHLNLMRKQLSLSIQQLEIQRKDCRLRINTLMATHNVFSDSSSSSSAGDMGINTPFCPNKLMTSLLMDTTTPTTTSSSSNGSIFLGTTIGKSNGIGSSALNDFGLDIESNNLQDMVSRLFNEKVPSSSNNNPVQNHNSLNTNTSNNNNNNNHHHHHLNNHFQQSPSIQSSQFTLQSNSNPKGPLSTLAGSPFFSAPSFRDICSSPISYSDITFIKTTAPCSFSEIVSSNVNPPMTHKTSHSGIGGTLLSGQDSSQSNSESPSPLSNFGSNGKDIDLDDDQGSEFGHNNNNNHGPSQRFILKPAGTSNGNNGSTTTTTTTSTTTSTPTPTPTNGSTQTNRMLSYNSVLALETAVNGTVFKSLADRTVARFRPGTNSTPQKELTSYSGHTEKVKTLLVDPNQQLLYTGCEDGKVRCFNIKSGSKLNEFKCEGSIIGLEKSWDLVVVGTNKGWIYMVKNQLNQVMASHRVFNWIYSFKPLVSMGITVGASDPKVKKHIMVLPMKHKPTIIDATDGTIIREVGHTIIESKPCVQVAGGISIIATVADKNEMAKSVISVYDAAQDWSCIQKIEKEGIVAALRIHGHDLYVGLKFPSFGHIECYKWSNKTLAVKWIACVAYVSCIAILPNDIVLNGGPDGSVYNTTPNQKGPFHCSSTKCKCKMPFARRKDLEFHYSKVSSSSTNLFTAQN